MLDLFFSAILMVNREYIIILIILTGYIFLKKDAFSLTFLIFAFAIILNPYLKSLFQIPLPPTAGSQGWAFPSGHMLTATVFWSWLALEYNNKAFYIFTTLLLTSYGIALVHFGYHYPLDIAGALFFALLTLYLYYLLLKLPIIKSTPPFIGFLLAAIALILIPFIPDVAQQSHIWIGFGSLLGFSLGWLISRKSSYQNTHTPLKVKFLIFTLSLIGLFAIKTIFSLINFKLFPITIFHYFILTLWLTIIAQATTLTILTQIRFIQTPNKACN